MDVFSGEVSIDKLHPIGGSLMRVRQYCIPGPLFLLFLPSSQEHPTRKFKLIFYMFQIVLGPLKTIISSADTV